MLKIKDTIDKDIKAIVDQKTLKHSFLVDKTFTGETSLVEENYENDPEVFD